MSEDEEEDEDEKQEDEDEFDYCADGASRATNPMNVISRRDVGSYAVQTTMTQMKKHLRKAHIIEPTSSKKVVLMNCFNVKTSSGDGLVQCTFVETCYSTS